MFFYQRKRDGYVTFKERILSDSQSEIFRASLRLITREETAKMLRISLSSLDHLSAAREIGFARLGRRCYYTPSGIEKFLESRRVEPVEEAHPLNKRSKQKQLRTSAGGDYGRNKGTKEKAG